jgi:hypothetical protein
LISARELSSSSLYYAPLRLEEPAPGECECMCIADDKLNLIESARNASCVRQKKSQASSQGPHFVCASCCCCCAPSFSMQTTFAGIMLLKARAQDNNQRFQVMLFIFIILSLLLDEMKGADRSHCATAAALPSSTPLHCIYCNLPNIFNGNTETLKKSGLRFLCFEIAF